MAPRYYRSRRCPPLTHVARLETNTLQAEGLFKKGSGFGGTRVLTKRPLNQLHPEELELELEALPSPKEPRRQTRSSTSHCMSDEWIKVPVEVPLLTRTGEWIVAPAVVFYSTETGSLYPSKDKLVYVEATVSGHPAITAIAEAQLPMMTVDHPTFIGLSGRIQEDRKRRLDNARHMRDLKIQNEEEWHRAEVKMAEETYERDVEKLKCSMLDSMTTRLRALEQMIKEEQRQRADSIDLDDAILGLEDDALAEVEKARQVVHEAIFKRPTPLPAGPLAPLWDAVPGKGKRCRERGREGGVTDEEEYVDMLEVIRRRCQH